MRSIRMAMAALAVTAAASAAAAAPLQVALVEDVSATSAGGVMLMDYVETGKVIALGPDDTLVLSYMTSCIQETIRGTVTVGTTQSEVRSGKVKRLKVACDAGKMLPGGGENVGPLAGSVSRGELRGPDAPPMLYGASPMVELRAPGTLLIERLDKTGERHVINIESEDLLRGRFYDFAYRGKALSAGGTYRAVFGAQAIVFQIAPQAEPGYTPVVSRLLRFGTAG
jgi:hypothetical protein